MSINFSRDIVPLYATRVATDPAYQDVAPDRRSDRYEQNLLTLIDTMKSFMNELQSPEQARAFHYTMGRMLAATPFRGFDDLSGKVCGNIKNVHNLIENGDAVQIDSGSSNDAIILRFRVQPASMAELVELINTRINGTTISVSTEDGRLCFNSPFGIAFTLSNFPRGTSLLDKAGISAGEYAGPINSAACQARDDALAHFQRVGSPLVLRQGPMMYDEIELPGELRPIDDDEEQFSVREPVDDDAARAV